MSGHYVLNEGKTRVIFHLTPEQFEQITADIEAEGLLGYPPETASSHARKDEPGKSYYTITLYTGFLNRHPEWLPFVASNV